MLFYVYICIHVCVYVCVGKDAPNVLEGCSECAIGTSEDECSECATYRVCICMRICIHVCVNICTYICASGRMLCMCSSTSGSSRCSTIKSSALRLKSSANARVLLSDTKKDKKGDSMYCLILFNLMFDYRMHLRVRAVAHC